MRGTLTVVAGALLVVATMSAQSNEKPSEAFQLCSLCLPLESSHSRDHAAIRCTASTPITIARLISKRRRGRHLLCLIASIVITTEPLIVGSFAAVCRRGNWTMPIQTTMGH